MLVEITEFRLQPGTDEDEFLSADRHVQEELLPFEPGFLRRTTARGDDGWWLTIVLWAGEEYADAAGDTLGPLLGVADGDSLRVRRYTTLD